MEQIELFGFKEQISAWEHLAVFTLQIDMLDETRYERKDSDLLLFAINNIIEEMIPPPIASLCHYRSHTGDAHRTRRHHAGRIQ